MTRLRCVLARIFLPRIPLLMFLTFTCITSTPWAFPWQKSSPNAHQIHGRSISANNLTDARRNCTTEGEKRDFPQIFGEEQLGRGAILLHLFATLYISGCIGYLCQVYFVPALEKICTEWKLPQDVAGATIMAAGTSLPELFAAIMGTFVTEDDTGTGAIVGSAAFNIYAILALCSFLAPKEGVKISWFPVLRDGFYWTVCMIVLIAVVIDGKLLWYESLILSLLYVAYVIVMVFNDPISNCIQGWLHRTFDCINFEHLENDEEKKEEAMELTPTPAPISNGYDKLNGNHIGNGVDKKESRKGKKKLSLDKSERDAIYSDVTAQYGTSDDQAQYIEEALTKEKENKSGANGSIHHFNEEDLDPSWCASFHPPKDGYIMLAMWVLGLPFITLCCFLIPDCRKPGIRQKLYIITFIMAALVCSLTCYLLFWVITVIGNFFGIPDIVMGYTLLAIGTSLPDAISSAIVSKHAMEIVEEYQTIYLHANGYMDLAIGNINGSNLFEITVCLGMVWFVRTLTEDSHTVHLETHGFRYVASVLLISYLVSLLGLGLYDWRLNKKTGIVSLVIYATLLTAGAITESFVEREPLHCVTDPV